MYGSKIPFHSIKIKQKFHSIKKRKKT